MDGSGLPAKSEKGIKNALAIRYWLLAKSHKLRAVSQTFNFFRTSPCNRVRLAGRASGIDHVHAQRIAGRDGQVGVADASKNAPLSCSKRFRLFRDSFPTSSFRPSRLCLRLRRRARSMLNDTSLSSRIVRSGCRLAQRISCKRSTAFDPACGSALISFGRISEAVAEHDAALGERGQNHFVNMLGTRRKHERHFRDGESPAVAECSSTRESFRPYPSARLAGDGDDKPCARRERASFSSCVLLPLPSRPSKVINFPRAATSEMIAGVPPRNTGGWPLQRGADSAN